MINCTQHAVSVVMVSSTVPVNSVMMVIPTIMTAAHPHVLKSLLTHAPTLKVPHQHVQSTLCVVMATGYKALKAVMAVEA